MLLFTSCFNAANHIPVSGIYGMLSEILLRYCRLFQRTFCFWECREHYRTRIKIDQNLTIVEKFESSGGMYLSYI